MLKRRVSLGQSLAEYTLVAGLLVISGVAGMQMLVGLFAEKQNTMWNSFSASAPRVQAAAPGAGGSGELAFTGTNYPLTIQGYEAMVADMNGIVETSGGAGATKELAAYIKSLAEQALKDGTIDETQANLFQVLANKGHDLGLIQEGLTAAIASAPGSMTKDEFAQSPLTINGETRKTFEWVRELENLPLYGNGMQPDYKELLQKGSISERAAALAKNFQGEFYGGRNMQDVNLKAADFLLTYHELEQAGAMDSPELAPVIEQLANTISQLSDGSMKTVQYLALTPINRTQPMEAARQQDAQWQARKTLAKNAVGTHLNSEGICTTGGGQDSGKFCN